MKTSTTAACVLVLLCGVFCCLLAANNDVLAQNQAQQPAPRSEDLSFERMSNERIAGNFYRTAVPGGWLVVLEPIAGSAAGGPGPSMVFIPDEGHKWDGKTLKLPR